MLPLHKSLYSEVQTQISNGCQAFLFVGDKGIGKSTLIAELCKNNQYQTTLYDTLNISDARSLSALCKRTTSINRAFVIQGDSTNALAFNALLKTIEEPPAKTYFFICCSCTPIQTIVSRCHCTFVPRLSMSELLSVLKFKGMSEQVAISVAKYAAGSVIEAYNVYSTMQAKKALIPWIKALRTSDTNFVFSNAIKLKNEDLFLLRQLVQDLSLARYGLWYTELADLLVISQEFLATVHKALTEGVNPTICYIRAWYRTR